MRNSVDITRKYQVGYMLLHHFMAVVVCAVIQAVAAWYFLDKTVARYIVGTIFTIIYGFYIYGSARTLSLFDNKNYTPLRPNIKWGVIWGLVITATVAVSIVVYKANWAFFSSDGSITNVASVILNLLFYLWNAPYFGFFPDNGGSINNVLVVVMLLIPVVSSTLGYWAGNKRFDIAEKLNSMTYEKNDDE